MSVVENPDVAVHTYVLVEKGTDEVIGYSSSIRQTGIRKAVLEKESDGKRSFYILVEKYVGWPEETLWGTEISS